MKKILSVGIILFVLLVLLVVASPPLPFPFAGDILINGIPQEEGYKVKIENIDSGMSVEEITHEGKFLYNLNNLPIPEGSDSPYILRSIRRGIAYPGDRIRITVCSNSPQCVIEFELVDTLPITHYFIIEDSNVRTPVQYYVCADGSKVTDFNLCPIVSPIEKTTEIIKEVPVTIEITKTEYVCSDGTKVESEDKCPIKTDDYKKIAIAVLITAGASAGFVGLYLYYRKKGQIIRAEKMKTTFISKKKKK